MTAYIIRRLLFIVPTMLRTKIIGLEASKLSRKQNPTPVQVPCILRLNILSSLFNGLIIQIQFRLNILCRIDQVSSYSFYPDFFTMQNLYI